MTPYSARGPMLGLVLIVLAAPAALWADAEEQDAEAGHWEAPVPVPMAVTPALVGSGGRLYQDFCAAYHGTRAGGRGRLAASLAEAPPDLRHAAGEHPPGELAWKIGTGHGLMPGWQPTLARDQVWAVTAFVGSLPD